MVTVLRASPGASQSEDRRSSRVESHLTSVDLNTSHAQDRGLQHPQGMPDREIVVRPAGVRDALHLRSVDVTLRLNQPESMLTPRFSLTRAAGILATARARKPVTIVAESAGELLGFAEFQPSMPDLRWQLVALGLQHAAADPLPIWVALLDEGTRLAGAAGVKRLYARSFVDSPSGSALRRAGYTPYARERIFSATQPVPATSGIAVREQDRADTWAVHQLYNSSVPREVLYAEAYTSHRWELSEGRSTRSGQVRAWICELNGAPVVYARSESSRRKHILDLVFSPGNVGVAAQLIDSLIRGGIYDQSGGGETYLAVRSYNMELEQYLLDRQFSLCLEQDLFVRYTTAPVRVVTSEALLQEADAHERAPKGVPAYYAESAAFGVNVTTLPAIRFLTTPADRNRSGETTFGN